MNVAGRLLVAAALALASGCARPDWIQQTLVTVDVTGTWVPPGGTFVLKLEQQGAKVTGSLGVTGASGWGSTVEGAVAGTVASDMRRQTSGVPMNCEGEMTVSEDAMRGVVYCNQLGRQLLDLKRVNSPPSSSS